MAESTPRFERKVLFRCWSFARPSEPKLETVAAETILREVAGLMPPNLEGLCNSVAAKWMENSKNGQVALSGGLVLITIRV